ncbi:MAG: hydrogenase nickel incorporation protein HypB [Bacteroidota bacterium]|nr:MAG: hydrogenase nickel incorporation protein HypB [Bacteroidota bacterium]
MCDTCGCSDNEKGYTLEKPGQKPTNSGNDVHDHDHSNGHGHGHGHGHGTSEPILLSTPVLSKNNLIAERNRGIFEAKNIKTFNLVSSPGSGKTTLLEKLIPILKKLKEVYVIEGDQQTTNDANRIDQAGAMAIQVNTGKGCHLDAMMIHDALLQLKPTENSLLFIENVGNLVCPSLFDLGENSRILISSVTEGADKPLKYPYMFESSQLCVINKTDLLPYVDFRIDQFKTNALRVNHHLDFVEVSATGGQGIEELVKWILA